MTMGSAERWTLKNLLEMVKLLAQVQQVSASQQLKERRRGPPSLLVVDESKIEKLKIYYH